MDPQADLFQIIQARRPLRPGPGAGQGRQQQGCQMAITAITTSISTSVNPDLKLERDFKIYNKFFSLSGCNQAKRPPSVTAAFV